MTIIKEAFTTGSDFTFELLDSRFLWNLDLCVLLLPAIADLLQSKFEV